MKDSLKVKIGYGIFTLIFIVFTIGPILWCFILSVTPEYEIMKNTNSIFPTRFYFKNYTEIFTTGSKANEILFLGIKNSFITSIFSIFLGLPISFMAAYSFSKYDFKGKKFILRFLLITIVIPVFTTIIPIYSIFADFGILDNLFWISVIYVSSFIPIITWTLINYFNSIPKELWEIARIEGCSEVQIFVRIVLPLSKSIIFTCILMIFIMSWNQFQIPLILISSPKNKVVTMILSDFMTRDDVSYGMISACGLISLILPATVAVVFRNFLISGLTQGALKE